MKKYLFVLALVAFCAAAPTEQGPVCQSDTDCAETDDTPYCVVVDDGSAEVWPVSGAPAITNIAVQAPVARVVDPTTGADTTAAVSSICARTYTTPANSPYVAPVKPTKKCLECRSDSHCAPGEWCVQYKSRISRPGSFLYSNLVAGYGVGQEDFTFKKEDHSFTHEEYGDETYPVGSCAPKGWPLGEKCSTSWELTRHPGWGGDTSCQTYAGYAHGGCGLWSSFFAYDQGANDKSFCGLVTSTWPSMCMDGLPFGWTAKEYTGMPDSPARHVQWQGQCIDGVCCECVIGQQMGDSNDMQCIPKEMQGTCGMWAYSTTVGTQSTYGINRNAVAQMQVVSLLLLILIAGLAIFGVCVKGAGGESKKKKANKVGAAEEGKADEGKADEGKADEGKADEGKAEEGKAEEAKAQEAGAGEG